MSTTTRERILDAAETRFARNGFAATSVREITHAAGANLASVNYYFGSKGDLLTEVLNRRIGPINQERLQRLDGLQETHGDAPVPLEHLLLAFMEPPFQAMGHSPSQAFMKLMARMHIESHPSIKHTLRAQFEPVVGRFLTALQDTIPGIRESAAIQRLHFAVGSLSHCLLFLLNQPDIVSQKRLVPERVLDHLVKYTAAGMRAEINQSEEQ